MAGESSCDRFSEIDGDSEWLRMVKKYFEEPIRVLPSSIVARLPGALPEHES
jgi:hypothetical protein